MAEAVLYNNPNEPEFPYEEVAKDAYIQNIPKLIDELTNTHIDSFESHDAFRFDTLIHLILVFARARTASLEADPYVPISLISPIVKRLNQILSSIGAEHHHVAIVRRNRYGQNYFLTNKNSRRFIWKQRLTHYEIGSNLDFFASGHMGTSPIIATSRIVEVTGKYHISIVVEVVRPDLATERELVEFEEFNIKKEQLFNQTMIRLNLPYRFKWFFWIKTTSKNDFINVMRSSTPPSIEWWNRNFFFVNGFEVVRNVGSGLGFVNGETRFEECWETIQLVFNFITEHFNEEVLSRATLLYYENFEKLFNTIRVAISPGNRSPQEIHAEIASLLKSFKIENADQCNEPPATSSKPSICGFRNPRALATAVFRNLIETFRMYTVERWKLNPIPRTIGMQTRTREADKVVFV